MAEIWLLLTTLMMVYILLLWRLLTPCCLVFRFSHHCSECEFDVCHDCFKPHTTPLHVHPLYKANSHNVYVQFNGGWRCDNCGSVHNNPILDNHPWHCQTCEYDLCQDCMRGTIEGKTQCNTRNTVKFLKPQWASTYSKDFFVWWGGGGAFFWRRELILEGMLLFNIGWSCPKSSWAFIQEGLFWKDICIWDLGDHFRRLAFRILLR